MNEDTLHEIVSRLVYELENETRLLRRTALLKDALRVAYEEGRSDEAQMEEPAEWGWS